MVKESHPPLPPVMETENYYLLRGKHNTTHPRRYSNLRLHSPSSDVSNNNNNRERLLKIVHSGRKEDHSENNNNNNIDEENNRLKSTTTTFVDGPLMEHLLKYSDFRKRVQKSTQHVVAKVVRATSARNESALTVESEHDNILWDEDEADDDSKDGGGGGEKEEADNDDVEVNATNSGDISVGMAKLNNIRASRVFQHVVVPMCRLRGMDLFLTDVPEEEIWRQPILNECGLRDVPTFVVNIMLPFGNMTAYFALPDWVDDLDNIPTVNVDDSPDIRAFKRFLSGDVEYRDRVKMIPCIVDGPLAIRMMSSSTPKEMRIHTPRHPTTWTVVPKSVDPITGKTTSAILECDIDFVSDKSLRKIINIVRPYFDSITIDVAFIIAKPDNSSSDEPCVCLGLWRVDKVDFESCAVFPEKTIDEVAEEVKLIMSVIEERD